MRSRILVLALVALLPTSCVANRAYHAGNELHREELMLKQFDPLETGASTESFPYRLSFVEFDDRGELFKRQQLSTALAEIDQAKKDASPGVRPYVVVFIHGWKNNASDSSGNVWGFRQVLANLSKQFKRMGQEVPVLGIYIGWRGAVVSAPILKEFTFFDRRRKSQSLPNAQMVETLTKIMEATKRTDAVSVFIGHSFGAAVLETALTDSLMRATLNAASTTKLDPPANVIVFINEAQEAIRSYQLIETMHANLPPRPPCTRPGETGGPQRPVVVSMSSTGDYATRAFYPGAQALLRPFNSLRSYPADNPNFLGFKNQSAMFFNTTAHVSQFQSHLMGRSDDPEIQEAARQCAPAAKLSLLNGPSYWIVEKPGTQNRTPYWVMHIPSAIVPDHSTIFTPVFSTILSLFILNTTM